MEKHKLISLLQPKEYEKVYIHNEIFSELQSTNQFKSATNIAFAYCYYCLICYLFRYCKYGNAYWFTKEILIEILGFAGNNKTFDYLIKKNGLLDRINLTDTISDFPIDHKFEEGEDLTFLMFKSTSMADREIFKFPRKYTVKKPITTFYRTIDSQQNGYLDGTYYDISNTHPFRIHNFIDIISNDSLGGIGFFIFQFLSFMYTKFPKGYSATISKLSESLSLSHGSISKYINNLEQGGYINIERPQPIFKEKEWIRHANTYFLRHEI